MFGERPIRAVAKRNRSPSMLVVTLWWRASPLHPERCALRNSIAAAITRAISSSHCGSMA